MRLWCMLTEGLLQHNVSYLPKANANTYAFSAQSPSHAVRVTAPFTQGGLWVRCNCEISTDKTVFSYSEIRDIAPVGGFRLLGEALQVI